MPTPERWLWKPTKNLCGECRGPLVLVNRGMGRYVCPYCVTLAGDKHTARYALLFDAAKAIRGLMARTDNFTPDGIDDAKDRRAFAQGVLNRITLETPDAD